MEEHLRRVSRQREFCLCPKEVYTEGVTRNSVVNKRTSGCSDRKKERKQERDSHCDGRDIKMNEEAVHRTCEHGCFLLKELCGSSRSQASDNDNSFL